MNINKRDILATSVRTIEELKRRYDLQGDKKDTGLEGIFPLSIAKGGTGATTAETALLLLSNQSINTSTTDGIRYLDMTADVVLVATSGGAAYLITNTNEMIGGLLVDGYEVALKPQLIWSNASPTSSFAAQTITLSDTSYDLIAIRFRWGTTDNGGGAPLVCIKGAGQNGASTHQSNRILRYATYNEDGTVTFTGGYYNDSGVNNSYCIPTEIWGI